MNTIVRTVLGTALIVFNTVLSCVSAFERGFTFQKIISSSVSNRDGCECWYDSKILVG